MFGFEMTDYDREVYETEIKDFVPNKIIDSHTHVYPMNVRRSLEIKYWPDRVAAENTVEDIIQTYKDLFPGKEVVPVIFSKPESFQDKANAYCLEVSKKHNFPALYLTDYSMTEEFLDEEMAKGGFKGFKPYFCNCKPGVAPREAGIYDYLPHSHLRVADKYGLTVVLHISKEERLKNKQNLHDLMEIEQKYPNVKLIVAHIGRAYAPEDIGDAFDTLKHSKNIMFDFCANTLSEAITKCIEAVGTKRILYGTDLPIAKMRMKRVVENGYYVNIVPRGLYGDLSNAAHMRETDDTSKMTNFTYEIIRAFKQTAKDLTLSKQDVEDVMYLNAKKLYNI